MKKSLPLNPAKHKLAAAVLICAVAFWPSVVLAITKPTTITVTNSVIDFGSFSVLPSCSNCSITITPAGVRTATAGIVLTSANPGHAATYSVTATCAGSCNGYTVAVTPSSASLPAGSVTMNVNTFTTQKSPANPPSALTVGATLTIPSSGGTAGTYNGAAFTVTTTP